MKNQSVTIALSIVVASSVMLAVGACKDQAAIDKAREEGREQGLAEGESLGMKLANDAWTDLLALKDRYVGVLTKLSSYVVGALGKEFEFKDSDGAVEVAKSIKGRIERVHRLLAAVKKGGKQDVEEAAKCMDGLKNCEVTPNRKIAMATSTSIKVMPRRLTGAPSCRRRAGRSGWRRAGPLPKQRDAQRLRLQRMHGHDQR